MKKFILGCLYCTLICFGAQAKTQYEFDVSVDVTAENVVEAKKQAMEKAIRDGVNNVLLTISTESSVAEFDKLNINQLQHFVSGIMVLMEKNSDVRYIADLRITVDEKVLKAYLRENMLPIVVGEEQDVLVVPLFVKEDGKADLWGEENVWRSAFLERGTLKKGNLNICVIEKNLGNITLLHAEHYYDMDEIQYRELANFNHMETVYVAKYVPSENKIFVKSFPEGNIEEIFIDGKDKNVLIDEVLDTFRDVKKEVLIEQNEVIEEHLSVLYQYERLSDWIKLKKHLESYPQIQNVKVVSMSNGKVYFSCLFTGVLEKLQGQLILNGYNIKKEGEHYVISK